MQELAPHGAHIGAAVALDLTHVADALYQRLVRVRLQRLDVYSTG